VYVSADGSCRAVQEGVGDGFATVSVRQSSRAGFLCVQNSLRVSIYRLKLKYKEDLSCTHSPFSLAEITGETEISNKRTIYGSRRWERGGFGDKAEKIRRRQRQPSLI